MHIPDGYLGPPTSGALFAIMVPLWITASRRVRRSLQARQVPLLAIGAAFSFVIMMFNVPIPGGSTGHAVGGALVSILLGPWAAMIAITVSLVIQALLFGDGGILALGANCFNMAVVLPFVGAGVYRLLGGGSTCSRVRQLLAAGLAGYLGLAAAAAVAGVEFGLQPLLHRTPDGQALYCPYGLAVAVTTMLGQHLFLFGWIEALVTALVVRYLIVHEPELLKAAPHPRALAVCWIALGGLALLVPLGILLPAWFRAGGAWGEWSASEVAQRVGYVPQGMAQAAGRWQAWMPDYAFRGWEGAGLAHLGLASVAAVLLGGALVVALVWLVGRLLARRGDFVSRSLQGALTLVKAALFAEESAAQPGLLQGIEPRIKLGTILLLLLVTLFTHRLAVLVILYLFALLLAVCSRLRTGFFLARTWLFIPLFSLAMAIPALFSGVSPGVPVAAIGGLSITDNGLRAAGFFIGRVAVSVSFVVLLSLTTRHTALLRALRSFGVPALFAMVLGICHRYIYLFVELVENTYRAIRSRTGGRLHHRQGQRLVAWNIGQLWLRSHALNEQVYSAMVARGFRGEPVSLERSRTRLRDWIWLAGVAAGCLALIWMS